MFDALPSSVVMHTFEFLSIKDVSSVIKSCKRLANIVNEHNEFWTRECLRSYISFNLDLYYDIYENEDYVSHIRNRMPHLSKKTWKQLLEEGTKTKLQFIKCLSQVVSKKDAENFVGYFYEQVKEPSLPIHKLKRENASAKTYTLF